MGTRLAPRTPRCPLKLGPEWALGLRKITFQLKVRKIDKRSQVSLFLACVDTAALAVGESNDAVERVYTRGHRIYACADSCCAARLSTQPSLTPDFFGGSCACRNYHLL